MAGDACRYPRAALCFAANVLCPQPASQAAAGPPLSPHAQDATLQDGAGHKPAYNLRTLCRALEYAAQATPTYGLQVRLGTGGPRLGRRCRRHWHSCCEMLAAVRPSGQEPHFLRAAPCPCAAARPVGRLCHVLPYPAGPGQRRPAGEADADASAGARHEPQGAQTGIKRSGWLGLPCLPAAAVNAWAECWCSYSQ